MATTTFYPAASSDDFNWIEGISAFDNTTGHVLIGDAGATYGNCNGGIRFDITSLRGMTVNSAVLKLVAHASRSSADCQLIISAIDAADPAAPTTYSGAENATRTTATVTWNPGTWTIDTTYDSPDIKTVLQELIDDYTVTHCVIYIEDNGSSANNSREFYSQDDGGSYDPGLYVDYSTDAGAIMTPMKGVW
jgi:hypothetical protein